MAEKSGIPFLHPFCTLIAQHISTSCCMHMQRIVTLHIISGNILENIWIVNKKIWMYNKYKNLKNGLNNKRITGGKGTW